jgi:hypothetical protein
MGAGNSGSTLTIYFVATSRAMLQANHTMYGTNELIGK